MLFNKIWCEILCVQFWVFKFKFISFLVYFKWFKFYYKINVNDVFVKVNNLHKKNIFFYYKIM